MSLAGTWRVLVWFDFVSKGKKKSRYCVLRLLISPGPLSWSVLSDVVHSLLQLTWSPVKHVGRNAQIIDPIFQCHFHQQGSYFHFDPSLIIRCLLTEVFWGLSSAKASFLHFSLDVSMELSLGHLSFF